MNKNNYHASSIFIALMLLTNNSAYSGLTFSTPVATQQQLVDLDFYTAIMNGHEGEALRLIKEGASLDQHVDDDQHTLLHYFARYGHRSGFKMANLLLNNKANINAMGSPDKFKKTPLHYAINNGLNEIAQLLIKRGANSNIACAYGWTALHYAAYKGNLELTRLLIIHNADLKALDLQNQTPVMLAKKRAYHDIQLCLENAQNYFDYGTVATITLQNRYIIPDYFGLAVCAQRALDIIQFFNERCQQESLLKTPDLDYFINVAQQHNKTYSYETLVWLKDKTIGLGNHDQHGFLAKKEMLSQATSTNSPFVDCLILTQ